MSLFNRKKDDAPQVIDLRDQPIFEFGFPTRCPQCHGAGYLDHIDPFKRIQYEHCPNCWAKWEHSEEELLARSS